MSDRKEDLKKYYNQPNQYLAEHEDFFRTHNPEKDVDFLIKALDINKNDNILDIACGQGRHSNEFARRGYNVTGVDFSSELISKAIESAPNSVGSSKPSYLTQDVEALELNDKFDVIYWFFSDFANINLEIAVKSIAKHIQTNGRVLVDGDSLFRIIGHLKTQTDSPYRFDPKLLELIDDTAKLRVPYPTYLMWKNWLSQNGLTIAETWGNSDFTPFEINSPRLIILAKK